METADKNVLYLHSDVLYNWIFSRIPIEDLWKLTRVGTKVRQQIFMYSEQQTSLDLSLSKWRLLDAHFESIISHFPNIRELSLESCSKITVNSLRAVAANCAKLTKINLQGCTSLDNTSVSVLARACSNLEVIDLRAINFETGGMDDATLTEISEGIPGLRELYLWNSKVTDFGLSHLALNCSNLAVLDLWNNKAVTAVGINELAENCPQLRQLNLSNIPTIDSQAITALVSHCTALKSLDLNRAGRSDDLYDGIAALVEGKFELELLKIRAHFNLSGEALASLAMHFTTLKELDLGGSNTLNDSIVETIAVNCPLLESLYLWATDVGDLGVQYLTQNCAFLTTLELWNCTLISDAALQHLAKASFATSLSTLILRGCDKITDQGLEYLSQSCHNLVNFSVRGCKLLTDKGILTLVTQSNKFEELMLSFCHQLTDVSLEAIGNHCDRLKKLYLPELELITDEGIRFISARTTLEELNLQFCVNITDVAMSHIAKLTNLTRLDCDYCAEITDQGVVEVAASCTELEEIFLSHIPNLTGDALRALVSGCRGLTEITLIQSSVQFDDVDPIERVRPDLTIEV